MQFVFCLLQFHPMRSQCPAAVSRKSFARHLGQQDANGTKEMGHGQRTNESHGAQDRAIGIDRFHLGTEPQGRDWLGTPLSGNQKVQAQARPLQRSDQVGRKPCTGTVGEHPTDHVQELHEGLCWQVANTRGTGATHHFAGQRGILV